ncbi:MAG: DUF397 domain-containing protein [Pseudonocardiaceae bacterium]
MISDSAPMPGQVPRRHWRKSSYSGTAGNCVEVADLGRGVRAVRDSKDPTASALIFTAGEWIAFTTGIRAGEFD